MAKTAHSSGGKATAAGREQWSGQFGFIMAAVGSAIGLGNIWRFPGIAYTNGGGAFLIPYLVALLTAGVPILLLDYSLGHRFRGSPPAVFRRINYKFEALGWFHVLICLVIMAYYAVILAWAARYMIFSIDLSWGEDTMAFFTGEFLKVSDPGFNAEIVPGVFWPLVAVWAGIAFVIALGVTRGIESLNKIFVPLLVVIFLALVVRALFLAGAAEGLTALFTPNWEALANPSVWIAAYSQIFFSLSVAFGIMITYSSYLKKKSDITSTALVTGFANSSFEILAGIGVFATLGYMAAQRGVGLNEIEGITGPILSFVTFPQTISLMPGGPLFGFIFFASLTIAGFTSLLSLVQVSAAAFQDKFGLTRKVASFVSVGIAGTASIIFFSSTNGLNALDVVDKYINEIGIVSSALIMIVLVCYQAKKLPALRNHLNHYSSFKLGKWWYILVAVVSPIVLGVSFVLTIYSLLIDGYGGYPTEFIYQFGWLMIALVVYMAFAFAVARWKTPIDKYEAVDFHDPEATIPTERAAVQKAREALETHKAERARALAGEDLS
ncbi:sodium-dependent transporter [Arcanobacterium hippocoleae]|uniref:NSS family neurotransmitter:Na+ symporter n=1 Tax=Arcanobacterium hippocoleae TaxID=149017 RepID=A0ABU1T2B9_9ACTO|nr:sodium-dependent transporter [Arcanobacterium hippocoleae]MDR6939535.1 NSS family neurotransmitter:Na+ symporter [Arcanobacterium hippocoleae]